MKRILLFIIAFAVAIILGVIIGRYSGHFTAAVEKTEKKPLYWIDSMEPLIHYPGPGKSRMNMELIPVYPDESNNIDTPGAIRISPTVVNNFGVRTAPVINGTLTRRIETVGYVEPNENKIGHVHMHAEGWVKKLIVKTVDAFVKKDQLLIQLYSPQLVNAQGEYLLALESQNQQLINASYKRLLAFHISEQQIQQLKQTRKQTHLVDVYAPQDGVIATLNVREGMHVMPETELMSLVDLSNIWMVAQVFEEQASWVKVGEALEARLPAFPEKVWKGEVEYVYPRVDPVTRTLKVRLRFNNPEGILKPNMYANITLLGESKPNVLSVPLEALIRTSIGDRVILSLGDGRFDVRPVSVGIESGDRVEVLSGLNPGEKVVISGQFLIDSESNLKSSFQRLETSKARHNEN